MELHGLSAKADALLMSCTHTGTTSIAKYVHAAIMTTYIAEHIFY